MYLLLLSLKKTPLLEITFVDTGFILLFAILVAAGEMEHFSISYKKFFLRD